jgi:hypothetical protein
MSLLGRVGPSASGEVATAKIIPVVPVVPVVCDISNYEMKKP